MKAQICLAKEGGNLQTKSKKYLILQIKTKEESVGLPKIQNHQDENTITCMDKIYKESFNKFIDFHWIVKYVVLAIKKIVTTMRQCKFPKT